MNPLKRKALKRFGEALDGSLGWVRKEPIVMWNCSSEERKLLGYKRADKPITNFAQWVSRPFYATFVPSALYRIAKNLHKAKVSFAELCNFTQEYIVEHKLTPFESGIATDVLAIISTEKLSLDWDSFWEQHHTKDTDTFIKLVEREKAREFAKVVA
ncbi:hypothetical protein DRZ78_02025 [Candidatus Aerophobetes bacterium]|uniref:Uncharacterized protein n=1 Tax=Aerophobetes bacterium TaxID=2030807 RepID=A0A662D5P5_UNCAE|nr:MAG: hypothetical protein DRZ78_02025 [Candidatus Aerophobetes bacterium]